MELLIFKFLQPC